MRTRTIALVIGVAALLVGGASAHAAAAAPPANDDFAAAAVIAGRSGLVDASNVEATKELGEPDHAGTPGGASVWYRWNSMRGGEMNITTCGSTFDSVLAVYTGIAVNTLTEVASNNDLCGDDAMVSFPTTPNTEYWIAVDGVGATTGTIQLEWFQRPHNDDRVAAETISGDSGLVTVSNRLGTLEPGEPEPAGPGGATVWYRWTAPSSGPVRFDTCASAVNDTLLAAYEGSSTVVLAADDDSCAPGSLIAFTAEAGKEYLISVDGFLGTQFDDAILNWSRQGPPPAPPANVGRPEIAGVAQEGETLSASDGTWSGTAPFTFTYEWARCNITALACQIVPGAVGRTYPLTAADVSFRMRVFVRATNSVGWDTMNSAATAPVISRPAVVPRNTALPTIAGEPVEYGTLTTTAGSWEGYPAPKFDFQWQSCSRAGTVCINIDGANESTLVLSQYEVGRRIRVVVFGSNTAGSVPATSSLTTAVLAARRGTVRPRCVVPNVRGKKLATARTAIRKARCRVGRVTRSWSARVGAGRVIRQRPAPRTRLAPQSRVHLVVSKGRRR